MYYEHISCVFVTCKIFSCFVNIVRDDSKSIQTYIEITRYLTQEYTARIFRVTKGSKQSHS